MRADEVSFVRALGPPLTPASKLASVHSGSSGVGRRRHPEIQSVPKITVRLRSVPASRFVPLKGENLRGVSNDLADGGKGPHPLPFPRIGGRVQIDQHDDDFTQPI